MNKEIIASDSSSIVDRPDWDRYFMEIAGVVARRATCMRRRVGAILVKDRRILTTGSGLRHCREAGCLRERLGVPSGERAELCRGLHAEQNAIIQAALHGVPIEGSVLYCTNQPCTMCAKMLVNAGVRRIVFTGSYPDELAMDILGEAGVEIMIFRG